ncbi:MAG: hypothetical protein ABW185_09025 [Sedimenticola sp.]
MEHNQNTKFSQFEQQVNNIEQHVSQIGSIRQSINQVQSHVTVIDQDMSEMKQKMASYDHSLSCMSDMCDQVLTNKRESDKQLHDMSRKLSNLDLDQIKEQNDQLQNKVLDLQCKSMRDSLVFTGIKEPVLRPGEGTENIKDTLNEFLMSEMDVSGELPFEHVYRRGRFNPHHAYPRPIVGKFSIQADREGVKKSAPTKLVGKPQFGIRELFPPEIDERRKVLLPIMRRFKRNPDNRVNLFRDKLFVNGREYIPTQDDIGMNFPPRSYNNAYNSRNGTTNTGINTSTRQSNIPSATNWAFPKHPGTQPANVFPTTPVSNRFDPLLNTNTPGKQKARSPLEGDVTVKKYRDETANSNPLRVNSTFDTTVSGDAQAADSTSVNRNITPGNTTQSPNLLPPHVEQQTDDPNPTAPGATSLTQSA